MASSPARFVIRPAEPGDAEGLMALTEAVAAEDRYIVPDRVFFTADQQRSVLERRDPHFHQVWVGLCESPAEVVGELEVVRGLWPKNRHTATLAMVVKDGARGRGIGSALLRELWAWAEAEGVVKLCLSVFASNGDAIRFYERHGFRREAVRPRQFLIRGRYTDEILMAAFLAE